MKNIKQKKYGLLKTERLTGKNNIANLYAKGRKRLETPLMATYVKTANKGEVRVLFSVPKRYFRKAVDRNRYKRLLRESYRLNKETVTTVITDKDFGLDIALTATSNQKPTFRRIETVMIAILKGIIYEEDN